MVRLLQTQNPDFLLKVMSYWRKYIRRAKDCEAELQKLMLAFKPTSEYRFCLLCNEKNQIIGFCVVTLTEESALYVMQASTDDVKSLKKAVEQMAEQANAVKICFCTERNPRAWQKLIGAKTTGYFMTLGGE